MTTAFTPAQAGTAPDEAVILRPAITSDADALRRLAELDSAAPLRGAIIVAERHGEISAALELSSGRSVADPFAPTTELLTLLETRAALLRVPARSRRRLRLRRAKTAQPLPLPPPLPLGLR